MVIAISPLQKFSAAHLPQEPFDAPQALAIDPFFVPDVWCPPLPAIPLVDFEVAPLAGAVLGAALVVPVEGLGAAAL
jgi:hypothetical protein